MLIHNHTYRSQTSRNKKNSFFLILPSYFVETLSSKCVVCINLREKITANNEMWYVEGSRQTFFGADRIKKSHIPQSQCQRPDRESNTGYWEQNTASLTLWAISVKLFEVKYDRVNTSINQCNYYSENNYPFILKSYKIVMETLFLKIHKLFTQKSLQSQVSYCNNIQTNYDSLLDFTRPPFTQFKEDEMNGTCRVHWREEQYTSVHNLNLKIWKRDNLGDINSQRR